MNVTTLRVCRQHSTIDAGSLTVFEINVKGGEVVGVRSLQRGLYSHFAQRGPFLFWTAQDFLEWFSVEEEHDGLKIYNRLWGRDEWLGHQAALVEIMEAFSG